MRIGPPYPNARRKRRLKWAVSRNNRKSDIIKEPWEISMALDPDRSSNLFSEPAHQYAATCISEISLIENISNLFKMLKGQDT